MEELVQRWLVQQSGIAGTSCTTIRMGWMVQRDERMVQRDERMVQRDERMVQWDERMVQRNGMGWFKVGATRWDGQPVQQCCNNDWCNETDRQLVYNDMGWMLQQCLVQ